MSAVSSWLRAAAAVLLLVAACGGSPPAKTALRKCCPAGQQLSLDLRTCTPLRRRALADTFYATDPSGGASSRARRAPDDWGWLPEDAVITDAASLAVVTVDDLRRAARGADRPATKAHRAVVALPDVQRGAPPPCEPHDTELLFWDENVQLFSNGSMLVHQRRPDLFRPPGSSLSGSSPGDEGSRSFLFPADSFCMDRLTLAHVETVPLTQDDEDVEREVEDAVAGEADEAPSAANSSDAVTSRATTPPDEEGEDAVEEVADDEDTHHIILLCPCAARGARCVRKCCHPQSVLLVDAAGDTSCAHDAQPAPPHQQREEVASAAAANRARAALAQREWGPSQHRHPDEEASGWEQFLLHGLPHCSNPEGRRFLLKSTALFNASSEVDQFWIMRDGSAVVDSFGQDNSVPAGAFCGEVALDAVTGLRAANLLVCADPGVLSSSSAARTFFGALAATGAAFLTATLLVHASLPELRRSLHSSNLMAHTGSLLLAYIALTVNALATPALPHAACLVLAFVMQFSFLGAFFWLNVMCVDISWAFSGLRLPQGSAAERDRKKFFWYSLYAWGGTATITLVTALVNFLLPPAAAPHALHPQIGVVNCWFKEKGAVLIYFYGPMAFLLLANLVLFVYTAARILAVRKDTAILHKADSARTHSSTETQRLVLYVKLFCLMGLTWITEIMSWAAGGRDYYWYATDVINLLRAVFIFIIFCCKRKVLRLMVHRFTGDASDAGGSRGGRSGAGPRGRGRGAGTMTSSLTIHQDARRLQHTASQDSTLTTVTSPSATPDAIVLNMR